MYVQHEPENRVCQRIGSCETDFASSIKSGQEPELSENGLKAAWCAHIPVE
jgi:hypothetical protein